ncbi:MAG: patatin-like phospholipase family protein, partial [Gammaproteobacteria bacterium]
MSDSRPPPRPASYAKKVGLVLQGGGALGSYQAGVYEALASSPYLPDWVAGISIGAINAALIAGNAPENRVAQLRRFWEGITTQTAWWPAGLTGPVATWQRSAGGLAALLFGQPGFFAPRPPHEWFLPTMPTSYYSTAALKETLEQLVDFDRINDAKDTRISVGAVNVRTGRFAYFDSAEIAIRPEHVMASGSLPPGFPPVEIDGEYYWDGGLVSNTPLQYVLDYSPRRSRLTFQVDVFQARGQLPTNLEEVSERDKHNRFSSRTRITTENFRQKHEVRHAINELMEILPPGLRNTE